MSNEKKGLTLNGLLKFAIKQEVSDIHMKSGRPPVFRTGSSDDLVAPKNMEIMNAGDISGLFKGVLDENHQVMMSEKGAVDFGWGVEGLGRLRINYFKSRTGKQAVMRVIPARIPTIRDLGLPKAVERITKMQRGLVLVTGAAGQGKSTTLAAVADQINRIKAAHIVTIEDPIEYMINDRKAIVTQREVGADVPSFKDGLRSSLRQDPDVIIVGEARDRETIETALVAAETGHLVLSTMHTIDARETVNRVTSVFTESEREYARIMLSSTLKAVVSQRLVETADGKGRVPAVELMFVTARIRDLLRTGEGADDLHEAIYQGHSQYQMQTFDQSLMELYRDERISYEKALQHSSNPADFALQVKGISGQNERDIESNEDRPLKRKKLDI